jgi:exosortase J
MSAIPQPRIDANPYDFVAAPSRVPRAVYVYFTVAVLGLVTTIPCLRALWQAWTTDALKSVGIFVLPACLVLILRAWRSIGWTSTGSWWGLVLILANAALGWIQLHSVLLLVFSPRWTTVLPPMSLPLVLYGAGVALLMGGTRLFRAAVFPICALWLANPVPRAFSLVVDLPLQTVSAHVARSFAMHLGQPLTPDHLRLMFTPEFGMFIAPGCNGIRGAVTMGLIALFAGYIFRFRWYSNAALAAGAVLLGYAFNLLRLCTLVLYYIVALHFPWLQNKAETADYILGAALFLCASFLLFTAIHRLRETTQPAESAVAHEAPMEFGYGRAVALALAACFMVAALASTANSQPILLRTAEQRFPQTIGKYTLVRTWRESTDTGVEIYQWAEYAPASGNPVAIGISPVLSWHDPLICHTLRGDHPVWQGPLEVRTSSAPVSFNTALYADGVTDVLDASTQCSGGACNEFATARTHFGLIYTRVNRESLLRRSAHSLPLIVRAELPSSGAATEAKRAELTGAISSFVGSADLAELTRP